MLNLSSPEGQHSETPSHGILSSFIIIIIIILFYTLNIYIYIYMYYSVQLNQSWEQFHPDRKTFNSEHLNFPVKELNVTDITEQ